MILSKASIQRAIDMRSFEIAPTTPETFQPASLDLRLSRSRLVYRTLGTIDLRAPALSQPDVVDIEGDHFDLRPGDSFVGLTMERVALSTDLAGFVDTRSTLARAFVQAQSSAQYVDPGYSGRLTLQMVNIGRNPVRLYPGMRVAQLVLIEVTAGAPAYAGKYGEGQSFLFKKDPPCE
jgi:dCTP deaminase